MMLRIGSLNLTYSFLCVHLPLFTKTIESLTEDVQLRGCCITEIPLDICYVLSVSFSSSKLMCLCTIENHSVLIVLQHSRCCLTLCMDSYCMYG